MKKLVVVCLVLVFGAFTAGAALAAYYNVNVTGGTVSAIDNLVTSLPGTVPGTAVVGLDSTYAPNISGTNPVQLANFFPVGNWDAAGWWQFTVTGSSGSDWNTVFGGGTWKFETTWDGSSPNLDPYFKAINTFDNVYGRWYKNNDHVWTYFGLFTAPNGPDASDPTKPPPTGIFAFVAEKGAPSWSDAEFDTLYKAGTLPVTAGTGTITAAPVPVPPSVWLLGSGLIGLVGLRRRFTAFLKK